MKDWILLAAEHPIASIFVWFAVALIIQDIGDTIIKTVQANKRSQSFTSSSRRNAKSANKRQN